MSEDVFSSEDVDDTEGEEVEVRLHYPDGIIQWHQLRPEESVAAFLSVARRLRPELPLGDVLWRKRSLTSVSKPEENTVSSLGVDSTSQFNVLQRAPVVSISLWMENGAALHQMLKLDQEANWKDVKLEANDLFCSEEPLLATAAAYVQELEYDDNGSDGRGIACFDPIHEAFNFNDAEFCYPVAQRDWLRISRRYLQPSSPLPSSKDNPPHVVIDNDTEFLRVINEHCCEPASPEAMTNPIFVAFIEGVRSDSKIFWKLRSDLYLDPDSQEVFSSRWAIPGGPQCHVIALLRRSSRPLHIPVPPGLFLEAFGRLGLRLRMENGRVNATSSTKAFPDMEHWQVSYAVDKFTEDFTAAACESCATALTEGLLTSKSPRSSIDSGLSITSFSPGINQAASFDCMFEASV